MASLLLEKRSSGAVVEPQLLGVRAALLKPVAQGAAARAVVRARWHVLHVGWTAGMVVAGCSHGDAVVHAACSSSGGAPWLDGYRFRARFQRVPGACKVAWRRVESHTPAARERKRFAHDFGA